MEKEAEKKMKEKQDEERKTAEESKADDDEDEDDNELEERDAADAAEESIENSKCCESKNARERSVSIRTLHESGPAPKVACSGLGSLDGEYTSNVSNSNNDNPDKKRSRRKRYSRDDPNRYLNFGIGDVIYQRYEIIGFLGRGSFGRVADAYDMQEHRTVALKFFNNTVDGRESGKTEIQFMKRLCDVNERSCNLWVQMLDYFEFQGHLFIVFEKLGDDLYTFLKENNHQPYQMSHIRHIAYQLIYSVKALHEHLVIHTDLKPENICFLNSEYTFGIRSLHRKVYRKVLDSTIRLIDFGSATHIMEDYQGVIQTRHYRCPEVVFGKGWSNACDTWSIGCILFELYTGSCLFFVTNDEEHVNAMTDILGPFPEIFKDTPLGRRMWEDYVPLPQRKSKTGCSPLRKYMANTSLEHCQFFDLLEELLEYNPDHRIPLPRALNHPFFELLPKDLKYKEQIITFYKGF